MNSTRVLLLVAGLLSTTQCEFSGETQYKRRQRAERQIEVMRSTVRLYQNDHPGASPSCDDLVRDHQLDPQYGCIDPWGRRIVIEQRENWILIRSAGPDGEMLTADDVLSVQTSPP